MTSFEERNRERERERVREREREKGRKTKRFWTVDSPILLICDLCKVGGYVRQPFPARN